MGIDIDIKCTKCRYSLDHNDACYCGECYEVGERSDLFYRGKIKAAVKLLLEVARNMEPGDDQWAHIMMLKNTLQSIIKEKLKTNN